MSHRSQGDASSSPENGVTVSIYFYTNALFFSAPLLVILAVVLKLPWLFGIGAGILGALFLAPLARWLENDWTTRLFGATCGICSALAYSYMLSG